MPKLALRRCIPWILALALFAASTALAAGPSRSARTARLSDRRAGATERGAALAFKKWDKRSKRHVTAKRRKHAKRRGHKKKKKKKKLKLRTPTPRSVPLTDPAAPSTLPATPSDPLLPVDPPLSPAPTAGKMLPAISGRTLEGQTLTATQGEWEGAPTGFAYQWEACDTAGEACENIEAATDSTYTLAAGDVGHTLRVTVTATNANGSTPATSTYTAIVTAPSPAPPPPADKVLPAISGSALEGQTLSATKGTWEGNPTAYAYQWQDCNTSGEACTNIGGATGTTHVLTATDVGHTLTVTVTATNANGSTPATSSYTVVVTKPSPAPPPADKTLPAISGSALEGQTLSATKGTWEGSPTSYAYQWQDCNTAGAECKNIGGATGTTHALTATDVGHTLRVTVTATNANGSTPATSTHTATIAKPPPPANKTLPAISGSTVEGQTLATTQGTWEGAPTSYAYQWQDCNTGGAECKNISGATGTTHALTAGDVGHTLVATVVATSANGSTPATSTHTAAVTKPAPTPPPTNKTLPAISGSTVEGQTLTATQGTWEGTPTGYAYQWQDCNTSGEACTNIGGATGATHALTATDVGHTLRVTVTATNTHGSTPVSSAHTATITKPQPASPPANKTLPAIGGTALEGQTLTATHGEWEDSPTSYAYQWQDCNTAGAECKNIGGATGTTHALTATDVGHTLRVTVTATNANGSTPATSTYTATVTEQLERAPACTKTVGAGGNVAGELAGAQAGAVICLSGSSYPQLTLDNVNPSGVVTLEPASGATVTIDGISMELDSNLTIRGFQLSSGVSVQQGASNLTFRDNHTSNTECGYFFYGYGQDTVSHIQVLENTMENLNFNGSEGTCSGEGVVFIGNVRDLTIDDNTIGPHIANHYTHTGGIDGLQENGNTFLGPSLRYEHGEEDHQNVLQIFGESENVEFSNNIMRDTGTNGGSLLFQEGQMKNVKVNNNLFDHDAEGYSVQIYPVEELEFTHNTVVGSHWGVYFRKAEPKDESYGDDYNVTDNIFAENEKSGGTPDIEDKGCSSNCTFDYNVSTDSSAEGTHSIKNWKPQWVDTTFYEPIGLPFQAGYRQE